MNMKKLIVNFKIPEWLDKELDFYISKINECKANRGLYGDDLYISLECAVDAHELTHDEGEQLNQYYIGGQELRV